jgi:8-oxo-dGTP diphosphatase
MVVAALILRDSKLLICQRHRDDRHGLKWEFPGGKVEFGETPRRALARELTEELGIQAEIGPEIGRYEFQYPARKPILLIFHLVTEYRGEPANGVFEQMRWESVSNLPGYDFLDGDLDFVRRLARGEIRLS